MGLLDDAIREHLELKRRRGADPAEVARAEQEALGPVRREREPAPPAEHAAPAPEPDDAPLADAGAPVVEDQPEPPPVAEPDDATRVIPPAEAARAVEAAEAAPVESAPADPVAHPDAPPVDPPAERAPAADPRQSDIVDQPTTEYRVEDLDELELDDRSHTPPAHPAPEPPPAPEAAEPPAESGGDDVLEETPDFLQETPEHDRLWFEQRPPRDFDFDG